MYNVSITLTTPAVLDDEDIVFAFTVAEKREVRKVERALMKGLDHLGKLADDADGKKSGIFAGTDPQEMHLVYEVTKDGAKWTKATHEWPNQTDVAREYLKSMLDGLLKEAGHFQSKQRRPKRGRGRA